MIHKWRIWFLRNSMFAHGSTQFYSTERERKMVSPLDCMPGNFIDSDDKNDNFCFWKNQTKMAQSQNQKRHNLFFPTIGDFYVVWIIIGVSFFCGGDNTFHWAFFGVMILMASWWSKPVILWGQCGLQRGATRRCCSLYLDWRHAELRWLDGSRERIRKDFLRFFVSLS